MSKVLEAWQALWPEFIPRAQYETALLMVEAARAGAPAPAPHPVAVKPPPAASAAPAASKQLASNSKAA